MASYQEQRGAYLIEARAVDLNRGAHWQPWLRLSCDAGRVCTSRRFDALKPVFGTSEAALRYAADLGRSLADEGALLSSRSFPGVSVATPAHLRARRRGEGLWRDRLLRGCRKARRVAGALARRFARDAVDQALSRRR